MRSLRWRLTALLWLALVAVTLAFSIFTYWRQRSEAAALLDYQMEQIAGFLAASSLIESAGPPVAPQIPRDHDADDDFIVTVRSDGWQLLYASQPQAPLPDVSWMGFRTIDLNGQSYRLYSARAGVRHILIAQQMESRLEVGWDAMRAALEPLLVLVPLLGLLIAIVVRRQFRPIQTAATAIADRPALSLSPLPLDGLPSEVRPLADEINRLLGRLRNAIDHERRFVADAAHALRTPLTALQLQADVLGGVTERTEQAARLAELRAGIRRAARLTHHLLALARSESSTAIPRVSSTIDEVLPEIGEDYRALASARGIALIVEMDGEAAVPQDYQDLRLIVGNLLDNALRYTPPGGTVALRVACDPQHVTLEVIDEGPGLPEAELDKVLDRFYRAPGDMTEGSGLGLAAVKGIVERVGGMVMLENRSDQSGLCARVTLPRTVNRLERQSPSTSVFAAQ
jgi:signal transduction histidine kinase